MACGAIRLAAGEVASSEACPHALAGALASTASATMTAAAPAARARRLT
jgi:hypothetical protein